VFNSWGLEEGKRALELGWLYLIKVEKCVDVNAMISLQWKELLVFSIQEG
jgi:hypothetical protein